MHLSEKGSHFVGMEIRADSLYFSNEISSKFVALKIAAFEVQSKNAVLRNECFENFLNTYFKVGFRNIGNLQYNGHVRV